MVFKNFEYFIAIAEEGSISKAAGTSVYFPAIPEQIFKAPGGKL